jgi:hypothetical protein
VCIIVPNCDFKELRVDLRRIDDPTEVCEQIWHTSADGRQQATGIVIARFRAALAPAPVIDPRLREVAALAHAAR